MQRTNGWGTNAGRFVEGKGEALNATAVAAESAKIVPVVVSVRIVVNSVQRFAVWVLFGFVVDFVSLRKVCSCSILHTKETVRPLDARRVPSDS